MKNNPILPNPILNYLTGKNARIRRIDYIFCHWQEIVYFSVSESDKAFAACKLEVYFSGGRKFSIYFGSLSVLWDIIHQPLFFGLKVFWFGRRYEIKHESNSPHSVFENNPRANWEPLN